MLALFLLIGGIILRFAPHASNFTPVMAIALFSGVYLDRRYAILLPLLLMIFSDFFIGMHNTVFFTWGSFILIGLVGTWVKTRKTALTVTGSSILSAVLFFIITNFGVWMAGGLYPLTWTGLSECFTLAIPFFRNTLLSSVIYSAVLFGAYELIALRVKRTRFARALLTA